MHKIVILSSLLCLCLLSACQLHKLPTDSTSIQTVLVSKDLGLKQCEPVSKDQLQSIRTTLQHNKIKVMQSHCASDGLMRVQMCGASQGKLGIYQIAAHQLEQAKQLGFQQVTQNQYQTTSCS